MRKNISSLSVLSTMLWLSLLGTTLTTIAQAANPAILRTTLEHRGAKRLPSSRPHGKNTWMNYRDSRYGFRISYPSDYHIVPTDLGVRFYPPRISPVAERTRPFNPQPSIFIQITSAPFKRPQNLPPAIQDIRLITVNGIAGYQYKAQGAPFSVISVDLPYRSGTLSIAAALDKRIDLHVYFRMLASLHILRR